MIIDEKVYYHLVVINDSCVNSTDVDRNSSI